MKKVKFFICILALVLFVTGCSIPNLNRLRQRQNTMVNEEQKEEKVEEQEAEKDEIKDCICTQAKEEQGYKSLLSMYVEFNTKDDYAAKLMATLRFEYDFEITDEIFKSAVETIVTNGCETYDCTENKVDLGDTKYGEDTTIKRDGKKVIVTYSNKTGEGTKATAEERKALIDSLENSGFTCE